MATRLEKLSMEEVSGVENPANELPGWLVMKSKDSDGNIDVDTLLKEVDRAESDFAILYSALKACEPYLADAPADVQAAKDTLVAYVEQLFDASGEGDAAAAAPADTGQTDVMQSKDKDSKGLLAGVKDKLFKKEGEVEKQEDDEPKPEEPAAEEEKPAEEPAEEPVEKPAEEPAVEKSQTEDLEAAVAKAIQPLIEGQTVLADALSATLDRVSNLEASRQGIDPDLVEPTTKSDDSKSALRAAMTQVARGGSITLG